MSQGEDKEDRKGLKLKGSSPGTISPFINSKYFLSTYDMLGNEDRAVNKQKLSSPL